MLYDAAMCTFLPYYLSFDYDAVSHCFAVFCHTAALFVMLVLLRIVCKTGAMTESNEGAVIANIGEAVILWETPFKYQVLFHCFIAILLPNCHLLLLLLLSEHLSSILVLVA